MHSGKQFSKILENSFDSIARSWSGSFETILPETDLIKLRLINW